MISKVSFGALPPHARYISEKLIVGANQGIENLRLLRDTENVSRVIDLRDKRYTRRIKEFLLCKILGIKYSSTPISLGNNNPEPLSLDTFEKIHRLISGNTSGKTYVHCNNGLHRSLFVGAFEEFKAGRIKSLKDFSEFLEERNYSKLRNGAKIKNGEVVVIPEEEVRAKIVLLAAQKQAFWELLQKA